ncbi:unnamed protein product [Haemonchus placei]|uniref:Secreted protein n=1 Tax=Haemonchus placei TaxID=6290 RepID=A0A0N4WL75_HAEPC|nr:unnamed protein product [Haemonchus placei]
MLGAEATRSMLTPWLLVILFLMMARILGVLAVLGLGLPSSTVRNVSAILRAKRLCYSQPLRCHFLASQRLVLEPKTKNQPIVGAPSPDRIPGLSTDGVSDECRGDTDCNIPGLTRSARSRSFSMPSDRRCFSPIVVPVGSPGFTPLTKL